MQTIGEDLMKRRLLLRLTALVPSAGFWRGGMALPSNQGDRADRAWQRYRHRTAAGA